jgi:hypothetical protein
MRPITAARRLIEASRDTGLDAAQPCVCRAPLAAHAGSMHKGGNTATGCKRYRPDIAHALAVRARDNAVTNPLDDIAHHLNGQFTRSVTGRPKTGPRVRPSDTGECRRRLWYRECPPEDFEPVAVDSGAATLGRIYHDLLARARQERYPWRRIEFPVPIPGLDGRGRVDEYDPVTGLVRDWKFPGPYYAWNKIHDGPERGHQDQVDIYGLALTEQGDPVETTELEYCNRATGEVNRFTRDYDHDRAQAALDRLLGINVALEMGVQLPRDRGGPSSDRICERYCPARDHCWSVGAARAAGRSPEGYTILGPDPDMAKIEWAAGRVWAYKQDLDDAKTQYDEARTLLTGIPGGTYGQFEVIEKRRRNPDWKTWATEIKRAIDERAPHHRLAAIEVGATMSEWVEIKPVRAAETETAEVGRGAA